MLKIKIVLLLFIGVVLVTACDQEKVKRDQYYAEGSLLYTTYCANCHQADGKGMASLYPSLHYLDKNYARFACIVKNGLDEEIIVNGDTFNRPMPANPKLSAMEIAEIATFVYNTWGGETDYVKTDSIKKALGECGHYEL